MSDFLIRVRNLFLIMAGYLVQILIITWPLALDCSRRVFGVFDFWTNMWLFWLVKRSLHGLFIEPYTDMVFYPVGQNILTSYGHYWLPILTIPLQSFMTLPQIYNLMTLLMLLASAAGGYLLVNYLTRNRAAAFISGSLLIWSPFTVGEMAAGSLEMLSLFWFPLFFYFLIRAHREKRLGHLVIAGVLLALAGPFNWLHGLKLCALFALYWLWHVVDIKTWRFDRDLLWRGPLLGLVFLAVVTPFLIPLATQYEPNMTDPVTRDSITREIRARHSEFRHGEPPITQVAPDIFDHYDACNVLVNSYSLRELLLAGYSFRAIYGGLSLLFIILSLLGMFLAGPKGRFWTFIWFLGFILSLGPYLQESRIHLIDADILAPLPLWILYRLLPTVAGLIRPYRIILFTILAGVVLSGYALDTLFKHAHRRHLNIAARVLIVFLLIIGEFFFDLPFNEPRPLADTTIPAGYKIIASDPPGSAMVEFPCYPRPYSNYISQQIYFQTLHQVKLFNSAFDRKFLLENLRQIARANSVIRALLELSSPEYPERLVVKSRDLDTFRHWGFRRIVVQTGFDLDYFQLSGASEDYQMPMEPVLLGLQELFGPPTPLPGDLLSFDTTTPPPGIEKRISADGNLVVDLTRIPYYRAIYQKEEHQVGTQREPQYITIALARPDSAQKGGIHLALDPPPGAYDQCVFWVVADRPGKVKLIFREFGASLKQGFKVELPVQPMRWKRMVLTPTDLVAIDPLARKKGERIDWSACRWISVYHDDQGPPIHLMFKRLQLVGRAESGAADNIGSGGGGSR